MGLLSDIIGSSIGDTISKVIAAFKVPPEKQLEAQVALAKIQADAQNKILDSVNAQIEVNKQEAASPSLFVAGWRPFIGWICGTGLGYDFVFRPIANGLIAIWHPAVIFQPLDLSTLLPLLLGILGLGGMRMYEKIQGAPGADKLL